MPPSTMAALRQRCAAAKSRMAWALAGSARQASSLGPVAIGVSSSLAIAATTRGIGHARRSIRRVARAGGGRVGLRRAVVLVFLVGRPLAIFLHRAHAGLGIG